MEAPGLAEGGAGETLLLARGVGIELREQAALLGIDVLIGLPQRGLRGHEIWIGLERFVDQRRELVGAEQHPPLAGDVLALQELLRRTAIARRRGGLRGQLARACSRRPQACWDAGSPAPRCIRRPGSTPASSARRAAMEELLMAVTQSAKMAWACLRTSRWMARTRSSLNSVVLRAWRAPLLQKTVTWPISKSVRNAASSASSDWPVSRADQREAGLVHLPHAAFVQPIQPRRLLDLGPREQQAPALEIGAARDQRHEGFQHAAQDFEQIGRRRIRAREGCPYRRDEGREMGHDLLDDVVDGGAVAAVLAAEIILDGRQVDAGALGKMTRAGAFVALGREHFDRGFENAPPSILAARVDAGTLAGDSLNHVLRLLLRRTINIERSLLSIDRYIFAGLRRIRSLSAGDAARNRAGCPSSPRRPPRTPSGNRWCA